MEYSIGMKIARRFTALLFVISFVAFSAYASSELLLVTDGEGAEDGRSDATIIASLKTSAYKKRATSQLLTAISL